MCGREMVTFMMLSLSFVVDFLFKLINSEGDWLIPGVYEGWKMCTFWTRVESVAIFFGLQLWGLRINLLIISMWHHLQVCVSVSCLCELGCKEELEIPESKKFNNLHEDIKKLYSKGNKTSLEFSSLHDDAWTLLLQQINTWTFVLRNSYRKAGEISDSSQSTERFRFTPSKSFLLKRDWTS